MERIPASVSGNVVRFENSGIIAIIETANGETMLDINTDFELRLKIGDQIDLEDADFYVRNGKIVTIATDCITVNNVFMKLLK